MVFVQVLAETVAASPTSPTNLRPVVHNSVIYKQGADEQGIHSAMQPTNVAAGSGTSLQMEPPVHGVELGGALGQQGKGDAASNAALLDDAAMIMNAAPDGQSGSQQGSQSAMQQCSVMGTTDTAQLAPDVDMPTMQRLNSEEVEVCHNHVCRCVYALGSAGCL